MGERGDDKAEVEAALARLGPAGFCKALNLAFDLDGGGCFISCPFHNERTPSMNVMIGERRTLRGRCFGCDTTCDAFALVAHVYGLDVKADFVRVLVEGCRLAGLWQLEAELCDGARLEPAAERPAVVLGPPPEPSPEKEYPDPEVVADFWARARILLSYDRADEFKYVTRYADREAYDELEGRGLSPEQLVDLDACRVILPGDRLPRWARYRGKHRHESAPWPDLGYRLIFPVYDAKGAMRGVRAWRVGPPQHEKDPKRLPPTWCRTDGLVLACPVARRMLETGTLEGTPYLLVVEGEPDFASAVTQWSDAAEDPPGVLGIFSGAWTDEIAARVPAGAWVRVGTDNNEAGDRYAREINASLGERCKVTRVRPTWRRSAET